MFQKRKPNKKSKSSTKFVPVVITKVLSMVFVGSQTLPSRQHSVKRTLCKDILFSFLKPFEGFVWVMQQRIQKTHACGLRLIDKPFFLTNFEYEKGSKACVKIYCHRDFKFFKNPHLQSYYSQGLLRGSENQRLQQPASKPSRGVQGIRRWRAEGGEGGIPYKSERGCSLSCLGV